jgi:hypothetical protein
MSIVLERSQRHAVNAGEYVRMGEAGVFDPEAHLWEVVAPVPIETAARVVDLAGREVRVFRDPSPGGDRASFAVAAGGTVSAAMLPGVSFAVAELFPG